MNEYASPAMTKGDASTPAPGARHRQFRVLDASIADIHRGYAEGTVSCRALVQAYLDRIAAFDKKGPALNAILAVNPDALAVADRLDALYAHRGCVGPLHGIPVILKDNFNTRDMPTTGGAKALAGMQPGEDAVTVSRLRRAGAIILAKANLHELAITGTTLSSLGGQTLNPYDLTRTPGGSSGGTAAAIAANFAVAGTGSDTLNSIRSPASAANLVGIRPTTGLVARTGIIPLSVAMDSVGPIARSVADACHMLDVMAGPDAADPSTAAAPPASWYAGSLVDGGLRCARVGVLRTYFGAQPIHDPVNRVMEEAIQTMRAAGATIIDIRDSELEAERLIEENSVDVYEFRQLFADYLAAIPGAPVKSLGELIATGDYHKSSLEFMAAADKFTNGMAEPEYARRLEKNRGVARRLASIFDDHRLDVILYPLQKRLVVPLTETDQADRNGVLAAITGFPAITVPGGFSAPTAIAPIGVPVGIDFLGRPWSEAHLIRLAYSFEKARVHRSPPRSTPQL